MSSLTGVYGTNGRITTTAGAPVIFHSGIPFDAAGALCIVASAPGGIFDGSVMLDPVTGGMMASLVAAIDHYQGGLPLDVNGALCTEVAAPVIFEGGVGITAAGRVAVN